MLDKHTACALVSLGRMSSEEYLRLFGEEIRDGLAKVRKQHDRELSQKKAGKPTQSARAAQRAGSPKT